MRSALLSLMILHTPPATAAVDDAWSQRFLTEAPSAWRRLEAQTSQLQIEGTMEISWRASTKRTRWRCLRDGARLVVERTGLSDNIGSLAAGSTGEYGYKLKRPDSDSQWAIAAFGRNEEALDYPVSTARRIGLYGLLEDQWSVMSVPLRDIIADSSFTLRQVVLEESADPPQVRVDFDLHMEVVRASNRVTLGGGHVRLSPDTWAVLGYEVEEASTGKLRGALDYASVDPPRLARVTLEIEGNTGDIRTTRAVFERYELAPPPAEAFSIERFGLTAPKIAAGRSSGWTTWAIAVGALGALLIGLSRATARRAGESADLPRTSTTADAR